MPTTDTKSEGEQSPHSSLLRRSDLCLRKPSGGQDTVRVNCSGEVCAGTGQWGWEWVREGQAEGSAGPAPQSWACISEVPEDTGPLCMMHHSPGFLSGACGRLDRPGLEVTSGGKEAPPSNGP